MANIYKEQQRALLHLRHIVEKLPKSGVNRNALIMELLTTYATSERSLQKYIDTLIENGSIRETEGTLYATKK